MVSFWTSGFEGDQKKAGGSVEWVKSVCLEHDAIEKTNINMQLLAQLAMGFYTLEEYVLICARVLDPVKDVNGKVVSEDVLYGMSISLAFCLQD